ncbi:hypothetical protein SETIT_3G362900v2 [Setaria italica]|uniref:DUF6598 domain-containing protein n=2 Tax=Setaria italica TaxID=4555 RepID=A0A368QMR1_SETIT|nr:uncharacterized protein LOC101786827 isoform X1 [Setaria italica]RCV19172.1 hypothetical protein SETIT_3G362900v2 [Setaria italica]
MEIEGGGGESAESLVHGRCKKRPPSPSLPGDGEDSPKSTTSGDDGDEWFISDDSGSEEDEDYEDQGAYPPFTSDNFPTASSDYDEQVAVLYTTPDINRRGPSPIMLFPAFKTGYHLFGSDYNLADKSEVSVSNDWDCSNKCHCYSMNLIQFIDAKIAGYQHTHPGHAKIFGFIAAREKIKPLRNYVYRRNIDNCEAVSVKRKTGVARLSLNSPARVISMPSRALIEFELHAISEDKTDGDDDLIIEGCTELCNMTLSESFIQSQRLYGQRCALDIKYLVLINAMEARVDIEVIRVPAHGINLKLLAKTSGFSNVIRLFRGTVMEVGFSASFAVAVEKHNYLDLYIEGSQRDDLTPAQKTRRNEWWQCGFGSRYHGVEDLVAELGDFAAVSVKISFKSYEKRS